MASPLGDVIHYRRPVERPFTAEERASVTVLFGGLTEHHDRLVESILRGSGFLARRLPTPDLAAYHLGRHYGNNGQCNPAYFTVGALIKYLKQLEADGLSREQIVDRYVFLTAGACGPCRFGMYEAEYRLGLQNAGFDGFRVLLFDQGAGVKASTGAPGLKFSVHLGLGVLNAIVAADILNDLGYQLRPYEIEAGAVARAIGDAADVAAHRLRHRPLRDIESVVPDAAARLLGRARVRRPVDVIWKIRDHLAGSYTRTLWRECRQRLDHLEIDRLQVKPVVSVVGEFWAQTTEGDGNFRMFEFLEREGAEVHVEPFGSWMLYLIWYAREDRRRRHQLGASRPPLTTPGKRLRHEVAFARMAVLLWMSERLYSKHHGRASRALGDLARELPDMRELADLARPYYHPLLAGGEGHLEVAKHIHSARHKLAHMVLSLKPFGCLPSTQSDGVQSTVTHHLRQTIFLPVETGSEGAIHAYSRVQMALGEARAAAQAEFDRALAATGRSVDDIRDYVAAHGHLRRAFPAVPRRPGVIGTAANFVHHVAALMPRGRERRR